MSDPAPGALDGLNRELHENDIVAAPPRILNGNQDLLLGKVRGFTLGPRGPEAIVTFTVELRVDPAGIVLVRKDTPATAAAPTEAQHAP